MAGDRSVQEIVTKFLFDTCERGEELNGNVVLALTDCATLAMINDSDYSNIIRQSSDNRKCR